MYAQFKCKNGVAMFENHLVKIRIHRIDCYLEDL